MVGCCEHCEGPSGSVHGGCLVEHLMDCHLHKDYRSEARHVTVVVINTVVFTTIISARQDT